MKKPTKKNKQVVDRTTIYKPSGTLDQQLARVPEGSRYYHAFKRFIEDQEYEQRTI